MKRQIKVSVIVPVYNMEMYIRRCLDSLINQSLRDIEIIIVNDGSTDDSQLIINEYITMYPQIIQSFVTENGGLSKARNFGVEQARGEYLGFVDSDDYVDTNMFESLYQEAKKTNADIICCPVSFVYAGSISKEYIYDAEVFGESVIESPKILEYSKSYAWNKIYRYEFWIKNKIFFPEGMWFEDTATIYPALIKAKKISCVNYPFYYYDKTRENAITKTISEKFFDIIKACEIFVRTAYELEVPEDVMEMVTFLCVKHIYIRIKMLRECSDNDKMICSFIHESFRFLNNNLPKWKSCHYFYNRKLANRIFLTHESALLLYSLFPVSIKLFLFKRHKNKLKNRNVLKSKLNKKIVSNKNRDEIKKKNVDRLQVLSAMDRILSNNGIKYFLNQETVQYIKDFDLICDSITIPLFISILYDADSTHRVPFILENYGVKQKKIEYLDGKIQHETYLYKSISFSISYYYSQQDANHKDSLFLSGQFFTLERMKFKEIEVVVAIETSYNQNDNIHTTKNDLSKSELYECIRKDHINSFSKKIRYKNFEHKHQLVEDELSVIHELQEISLAILKETVRVCDLLGLQYYLGEGTLLGAIRHSGFIPWDDDVDILMPRDDYDRFLSLAPSYISGDYLVQHWTTTKPFFSIFTKVRYVGYSKFYQKQLIHITENSGPYIDIFPLDTVPHLFSKPQMKQKKRMRFLQRALSYSTKVADPPLKRYHIKIYGKLIPYDSLIKKISRQYIKFSNVGNKYYTNLASWYGTDKETFPIEFFGKGRKVPFEDTELIVPDRAEDILSIIYGDYLKLPPIRKRRNKHGFTIREEDD